MVINVLDVRIVAVLPFMYRVKHFCIGNRFWQQSVVDNSKEMKARDEEPAG